MITRWVHFLEDEAESLYRLDAAIKIALLPIFSVTTLITFGISSQKTRTDRIVDHRTEKEE